MRIYTLLKHTSFLLLFVFFFLIFVFVVVVVVVFLFFCKFLLFCFLCFFHGRVLCPSPAATFSRSAFHVSDSQSKLGRDMALERSAFLLRSAQALATSLVKDPKLILPGAVVFCFL